MRFDLPQGLKLVHEMRIPVRWGDLDAMGHFFIAGRALDEKLFS
jgi:hypothetical protein